IFFQAEDGIRDFHVTGVQTCALPISIGSGYWGAFVHSRRRKSPGSSRMNLQSAREKLSQKLADVSEVTTGVFRGIRRNNERDVAAYVFDLNNSLPDTVGTLSSYLDEVIGPAYFDK